MAEVKTLNVASGVKGKSVLRVDTGEKLGEVSDVIVHPTGGTVLGILVESSEGSELAIAVADFFIGADAIMLIEDARLDRGTLSSEMAGGVPAIREIIGTNVVTEDGKLLGRISEVHISTEVPRTFYRVAESTLQRFFGGGFFISGDVPRAYSRDGVRMIVPADTEHRFAMSSLEEATLNVDEGARQTSAD